MKKMQKDDDLQLEKRRRIYSEFGLIRKLFYFWYWKVKDLIYLIKFGRRFTEYGVTMYCGQQGAGKTIAMVEYLERMRLKYPRALILTNFGYIHQHQSFDDWKQFFEVRNGEDGVIFAIDEIQNEYNSSNRKTFPEGLLTQITQQRKQKIKIVCTSQVYTRVVKQLREQTFEVVECRTLGGRWTFTKAFDAWEYEAVVDNPEKKTKLRRAWRRNFVQDSNIRELYDSYSVVEKMAKTEYLPRNERTYNTN